MQEPLLNESTLERLIISLIAAELREGRSWRLELVDTAGWSRETSFEDDGLAFDSLDLLAAAGRVNQFFHLHEVGIEDYLLRDRTIGKWVDIVTFSLKEKWDRITVQTSGSTGTPKPCTHDLSALTQEVEELGTLFPETKRILAFVPSHHIYGFLFTVLLPRTMSIPVIDARFLPPGKLVSLMQEGDLIVSFPSIWNYLARSLSQFPEGVRGTTSTAPMPQDLSARLREQGLATLYEIYGSSETAGIGWRNEAGAPYRLFSYWQRDGENALRRMLPDGTRSQCIEPPDLLLWESPGYDDRLFRPIRRRDNAVQVGGINVFPDRIAAIICEHPDIRDCSVRLSTGDGLDCLKAFIVPETPGEPSAALLKELHHWCRDRLTPLERPRLFTFGPQVPENDMGKAANW